MTLVLLELCFLSSFEEVVHFWFVGSVVRNGNGLGLSMKNLVYCNVSLLGKEAARLSAQELHLANRSNSCSPENGTSTKVNHKSSQISR